MITKPVLRLDNVIAGYANIICLKDVSMEVGQGEIVALLGANGAGKTTTLMAISGLVHLRSGSITFEGRSINGIAPEEIPARGIVHIPEGRRIFPRLTVLENLRLGAYLRRSSHYIEKDMRIIWDMFPILKERSNQLAGTLSGGEQQMLAIGRGLMLNPKLLMLDEPSLGLAPKFVTLIFEVIKRINASGVTVLLIEQNAHMALGIADRGYLLETGKIVLSDDAKSLSSDPRIKSAYLGG